jgi:aminoglycoside 3-N-acetyltransferase
MLSFRDVDLALGDLGLDSKSRIILHVSGDLPGKVAGGKETLMGALLENAELLISPAFTYRTMVIPGSGPTANAIEYGAHDDLNKEAEIFNPGMPVDPELGPLPEAIRQYPESTRSTHPILSFTGIGAEEALNAQGVVSPLSPIEWLAEFDGDVLLIDADHTSNVSIHLGEQIAGRKTFTRWALGESGIIECANMPGCSQGFEAIRPRLDGIAEQVSPGGIHFEIVPLRDLLNVTAGWIREDPKALLCGRSECLLCPAVRATLRART